MLAFRNYPLLLGIMSMSYLLSSCSSYSSEGTRLFEEYYEPAEIVLNQQAAVLDSTLLIAHRAYKAGDFQTVAELTSWFTREKYELPKVMLALSIAYIELEYPDSALTNLNILEAHHLYRDPSRWYRALIYVKAGDFVAAIPFLRKIADDPYSEYREQAKDLLNRITKD